MTPEAGQIGAPEKLSSDKDVSEFDSGEPALDDWLRRRVLQNEATGASRTYVVCLGKRVVGYYARSAGAIGHTQAPGRIKRNMPDPVPVIILGAGIRNYIGSFPFGRGSGRYERNHY